MILWHSIILWAKVWRVSLMVARFYRMQGYAERQRLVEFCRDMAQQAVDAAKLSSPH